MGVTQTLGIIGQMMGATGANPAGTAGAGAAVAGIGLTSLLGMAGTTMTGTSSLAEASALRNQGDIAYNEALLEADRLNEQGRQYKATQKMSYVMSGVQVSGTPMQILQDTALKTQDQVNATVRRGEAQRNLAYAKSRQTSTKGITGFLSGLGSTATSAFNMYSKAKAGGLFDSYQQQGNPIGDFGGGGTVA